MPACRSWPLLSSPPVRGLLLWCALSLVALSGSARAGRGPALETIPEWVHLSVVWNTLTEHSSGLVYSYERLQQLVPEMDQAEMDLAALVARKVLSPDVAHDLRIVLQERYSYIEQHCYGLSPRLEVSELEAAEAASRWVVEMQLDVLRQSAGSTQLAVSAQRDGRLLHSVQASLIAELSFLWQGRAIREEMDAQRRQLDDKESRGEKVERTPTDVEWTRQQRALVDAYRQRHVRADRAVERLVPYLLRLTLTPPPPPKEEQLSAPPLFPF